MVLYLVPLPGTTTHHTSNAHYRLTQNAHDDNMRKTGQLCILFSVQPMNRYTNAFLQQVTQPQRASICRRIFSTQLNSSRTKPSPSEFDTVDSQTYASSYHAPVMYRQCINALFGCNNSQAVNGREEKSSCNGAGRLVFVDAALGGGGRSLALLQHMRP